MTKAKKQTSARVSTMAAKLLAKLPKRGFVIVYAGAHWSDPCKAFGVKTLRSICLSAISQDETKGQAPKTTKRRKGQAKR